MSLFAELKRRNVIRVGIAYAVVAWLLLQVADVLIDNLGAPGWVFSTLLVVLALGFPAVLVFAWAFELTPEGIKREHEVDRSASKVEQTSRRLDILVLVALALMAGWFVADEFYFEPRQAAPQEQDAGIETAEATQRSVAVLPFRAMSSGEDDEYFADGLTEEILNSLAQLPELMVTARTSSFFFKDQDIPIPEIAERLGVNHVVEGSLRRSGERVRITAQLIRAEDGFHLWSDTYDRTLEDVFAVQEDIAASIAQTLDVVLDENKRQLMQMVGLRDPATFIALQKAREAFVLAHEDLGFTEERLEAVRPLLEDVIAEAPGLMPARVMLLDQGGHTVLNLASGVRAEAYPGEAQDAFEALHEAYDAAWRATPPGVQRDILDVERTLFQDDWTGLDDKLERALRPEGCVQSNWTQMLATAMGYAAEALDSADQRLRCDPLSTLGQFNFAVMLTWAGRPAETVEFAETARAQNPSFPWMTDVIYRGLLAQGKWDHSLARSMNGAGGGWGYPRELPRLAMEGEREAALGIANAVWDGADGDDASRLDVAAIVGDRDRANRYAGRIDARPGGPFVLVTAIHRCACGAPFELEATPNFARRIEEAGFDWPPASPIDYPDKDW